jgi:hypothetical protein
LDVFFLGTAMTRLKEAGYAAQGPAAKAGGVKHIRRRGKAAAGDAERGGRPIGARLRRF